MGRNRPTRGLAPADRPGTQRAGRRSEPRHPLPSRLESRSRRSDGCCQRQDAVAVRVSDVLPRRFRLRRGPARGAGGRQWRRVYVWGRGATPRRRSRERHEDLERGHHAPVRRAERLLWRGRFAARRGRKGRRKHRRKECRHRGVRREDRKSALDGHRRWSELLVGDWRHDRRAPLRGVSDAQRAGRARSRGRSGAIRAAMARQTGRIGECGDAGHQWRFDFRFG